MNKLKLLLLAICGIFTLNAFAQENNMMPCSELVNLKLPEVTIREAKTIEESNNSLQDVQSHCKVSGTISQEINFELLLPESWNGRFVMGGGGGFVGYVMNRAAKMVHSGFATVGTDTGHEGTDASWALNNMERQLNFGHMAVHRTAMVSKGIIHHFYDNDPKYSYFIGLSRGGGQAMMEAQRYPTDFDGIIAGAPAFNWVGMSVAFIQNTHIMYPNSDDFSNPTITMDNLRLLEKNILQQCDALDGADDSILNDPRECDFDLDQIPICANDQSGPDCLTSNQLKAIKAAYEGVTQKGTKIHPGFPLGGENYPTGWNNNIVGSKPKVMYPSNQAFFGIETFKYMVFNNPNWDYAKYDFNNVFEDTRYASSYLDATNPDYNAFKNHGGKMIIYQGWVDPLISALDIIDHYEKAEKLDPQLSNYIKLYMLPGVTHNGGKGPAKTDWFQLIQDWVENGKAPERIVVSKYEDDSTIMTRPVYPYPDKAIYAGKGDPNLESSFIKK